MAGQMPVVVVPGGERQLHLRGQRLRPMAAVARCPSAAVSYIFSSDSSSSLPSPRGAPGHSDRPRRSPPDPSLPPHRCPTATTTDLLPVSSASRYCHLAPSGHGGLCASLALGLAKPLLQPSRSISSAHFLLLKAVVLAVADGRRAGRRAAAFPAWLMAIPSDARPTCFHHIERAVR